MHIRAILALSLSGLLFAACSVAPADSVPADGRNSVTLGQMGISLMLPEGWTEKQMGDPVTTAGFSDADNVAVVFIVKMPAPGDFGSALAAFDAQSATGYEGQASILNDSETELVAGSGVFRHRTLLAAGMKDIAAIFELGDSLYVLSMHRDDGSDPTESDERTLKEIASSVKAI